MPPTPDFNRIHALNIRTKKFGRRICAKRVRKILVRCMFSKRWRKTFAHRIDEKRLHAASAQIVWEKSAH